MSKAEFIKTLNNTNWESFTIDDLNKYEGLERGILLNQYHIWLWNEGKKPLKKCNNYNIEIIIR